MTLINNNFNVANEEYFLFLAFSVKIIMSGGTVCVLAPNGRRNTIKYTPNTTILQVLQGNHLEVIRLSKF